MGCWGGLQLFVEWCVVVCEVFSCLLLCLRFDFGLCVVTLSCLSWFAMLRLFTFTDMLVFM